MNKTLLIVLALSFSVSNAFASKARVSSLQGAYFLKDAQFMFLNPAQMHHLPNFLTYELGGTTNTAAPKAEGGLIKNYGKSKAGIYLGHIDSNQAILRAQNAYQQEENPIDFFYGKDNWGANLSYSSTDKKTTDVSQERVAAKYGINSRKYEAFVHVELVSKADKANDTYSSSPLLTIGGEYDYFKDIYTYGKITKGTAKYKVSGTKSSADVTKIDLVALDRTIKTKKSKIYFGPGFKYQEFTVKGDKEKTTEIPFYIGIQYDLKTWMELRASISQNFVLGSTIDETNTPPLDDKDSISNNTTVTVGTGIIYDDLTIDGVFAGSTNGNLNSNTFLANVALTFKF